MLLGIVRPQENAVANSGKAKDTGRINLGLECAFQLLQRSLFVESFTAEGMPTPKHPCRRSGLDWYLKQVGIFSEVDRADNPTESGMVYDAELERIVEINFLGKKELVVRQDVVGVTIYRAKLV